MIIIIIKKQYNKPGHILPSNLVLVIDDPPYNSFLSFITIILDQEHLNHS